MRVLAGLDPAIHENTEFYNQANDLLAKVETALERRQWPVQARHDREVSLTRRTL